MISVAVLQPRRARGKANQQTCSCHDLQPVLAPAPRQTAPLVSGNSIWSDYKTKMKSHFVIAWTSPYITSAICLWGSAFKNTTTRQSPSTSEKSTETTVLKGKKTGLEHYWVASYWSTYRLCSSASQSTSQDWLPVPSRLLSLPRNPSRIFLLAKYPSL